MEPAKNNFGNQQTQSETKLHFLDYWRIIRIRKTVILAVFLLVVLTTTAVTFILPETYMSTARIEVGKDTPDIPTIMQPNTSLQYDPYFIQTEFEKIKSTKVLNKVIENLHLTQAWATRFGTETLKMSEAYKILVNQIDLRQSRNTSLIEIRAYSDVKKEAADIANEIAKVYGETREEARNRLSAAGLKALKEEYDRQAEEVKKAQEDVDQLRATLKISDIGDSFYQTTTEPEAVRAIDKDRVQAEEVYTYHNTLLQELKKLPRAELRNAIPTAFADDHLSQRLAELSKAEQSYASLYNDYGDEHPEVKRLKDLLVKINQQIEDRIDGILKGLEVKVAAAKEQVVELKDKVVKAKQEDTSTRQQYAPYFLKKRTLENKQRILDTVYMRVLAEKVDQQIPKGSSVIVVDEATVENKPVRPNIPLNISLGVIVGLIMGFGLAFFIEYLDTSVKTIDDVERALQAPVLGVIPQNVGSLIQEGPDSPHAEAYRVLRTNLLFSRKQEDLNTITVVSGGAGEGKSTTIFNLATVFAQNGSRVLLVDSDLRRPSLHKLLNVSNSLGLTNFLLKQNTIEEVIQTTSLPTLHFLPSGKLPSSSLGVLNSAQMREFIKRAKERYDFVFFDSPPIMGVSDASILASEVDIAMLVIQYRKYPQVMTLRAKQMVEKVGGNLLGVVLNNINISQDSYYYYYSGYYYDYYSRQEDDAKHGKNGKAKNGEAEKAVADRGASVQIKQKY
ncbi:MAG TPA: polysaccharide biosynthesis tyrosine autokinase [Verrucomicrobiae bacterium]|jgi:capsular exopolysaccharide synthesis family protein|nr:polysaccharide biosynthesis tyrosine autokinase [Verrucomicrobiae bacterium]